MLKKCFVLLIVTTKRLCLSFNFVVAVGDIDLLKHFEGMKAVTNDDDEKVYTIQLVTEAANFLCRKHGPVLTRGQSDMFQILSRALTGASCF